MQTRFSCSVQASMRRRTLDGLAQFCAVQRYRFDSAAWMCRSASDGRRMAFVAHYLSMTGWYGHDKQLQMVAEEICPGVANIDIDTFAQNMRAMGVDLAQLSFDIRFGPAQHRRANLPDGQESGSAA